MDSSCSSREMPGLVVELRIVDLHIVEPEERRCLLFDPVVRKHLKEEN